MKGPFKDFPDFITKITEFLIENPREDEPEQDNKLCPFCGGIVDPEGWLDGEGNRGPECEWCGATAPTIEIWNKRVDDEY